MYPYISISIYIHIDTHHVQRKSWTRFCQVRPWSFLDDSLVDLKHMNSVSHAQAAAKAPMGQRQKKIDTHSPCRFPKEWISHWETDAC